MAWSAKSAKIPVIGKYLQWRIIWFYWSYEKQKQKQTKTTTKTKQRKNQQKTKQNKTKQKTRHRNTKQQQQKYPTYQFQQKDRKILRQVKSGRKIIKTISSFALISDQNRFSHCNINTISSRQVMRIEKNINYGIISWSNTDFPTLISWRIVLQTVRRITNEILGVNGLKNPLSVTLTLENGDV